MFVCAQQMCDLSSISSHICASIWIRESPRVRFWGRLPVMLLACRQKSPTNRCWIYIALAIFQRDNTLHI